jgi:hypothetical protein
MVKNNGDVGSRSIKQDSSFEDFFTQFSRDSLFQISRIQFPLNYSYFEGYNDSLLVERIEQKDWNYIDFGDDSFGPQRQ